MLTAILDLKRKRDYARQFLKLMSASKVVVTYNLNEGRTYREGCNYDFKQLFVVAEPDDEGFKLWVFSHEIPQKI